MFTKVPQETAVSVDQPILLHIPVRSVKVHAQLAKVFFFIDIPEFNRCDANSLVRFAPQTVSIGPERNFPSGSSSGGGGGGGGGGGVVVVVVVEELATVVVVACHDDRDRYVCCLPGAIIAMPATPSFNTNQCIFVESTIFC